MTDYIDLTIAFRTVGKLRSFSFDFPAIQCSVFSVITDGNKVRYMPLRNLSVGQKISETSVNMAFDFDRAMTADEFIAECLTFKEAVQQLQDLPYEKQDGKTPDVFVYGVSSNLDDTKAIRIPVYATGADVFGQGFPAEGTNVKKDGYWFRIYFSPDEAIRALWAREELEQAAYRAKIEPKNKERIEEKKRHDAYVSAVLARQQQASMLRNENQTMMH